MKQNFTLSAGALARKHAINQIKYYCDYNNIKYSIKEYKSLLSSSYIIDIEGDRDKIEYLFEQLNDWSKESAVTSNSVS